MKAIREIEQEGYSVSLEGNRIQARKKAGYFPDVGNVKEILGHIKAHKGQAITYLKKPVSLFIMSIQRAIQVGVMACL